MVYVTKTIMLNNIYVKHLNGKLHNHFIFKMSANGKLDNGDKVYCIHCNKTICLAWFKYFTDLPSSAQTHAQVSARDKK